MQSALRARRVNRTAAGEVSQGSAELERSLHGSLARISLGGKLRIQAHVL